MARHQDLELFSETTFDHRVPERFPVTCPTVDLSASWDAAAEELLIYRPVDQVVSKIHQHARRGEDTPKPQAVTWKPDGEYLLSLSLSLSD
jgi:anaphase-promoting complex subunit 4